MDHGNSVGVTEKKCSHRQCVHGRCLNHAPEWENVGKVRREPNPGTFGAKTYWLNRCCDKAMARYKEIQLQQCKKCGRTREVVTNHYLALCLCCGHTGNRRPPPAAM